MKAGAICLRRGPQGIEVLLIRSSGGRWIYPGSALFVGSHPDTVSHSSTDAAYSQLFPEIRILLAERMTSFAMSFCLPRVIASFQVNRSADRFKMKWVNAPSIATEMIQVKAFGDCADVQKIGKPMGSSGLAIPVELCVPPLVDAPGPDPTWGSVPGGRGRMGVCLGQESLFRGKLAHGVPPPTARPWPERINAAGLLHSSNFTAEWQASFP